MLLCILPAVLVHIRLGLLPITATSVAWRCVTTKLPAALVLICLFIYCFFRITFFLSDSYVQIRFFRFVCLDLFLRVRLFRFVQICLFRLVCSDSFLHHRFFRFVSSNDFVHIILLRVVCSGWLAQIIFLKNKNLYVSREFFYFFMCIQGEQLNNNEKTNRPICFSRCVRPALVIGCKTHGRRSGTRNE